MERAGTHSIFLLTTSMTGASLGIERLACARLVPTPVGSLQTAEAEIPFHCVPATEVIQSESEDLKHVTAQVSPSLQPAREDLRHHGLKLQLTEYFGRVTKMNDCITSRCVAVLVKITNKGGKAMKCGTRSKQHQRLE